MPRSDLVRALLVLAGCCVLGVLSTLWQLEGIQGFGTYPLGLLAVVLLQVRGSAVVGTAAVSAATTAVVMWTLGQSAALSLAFGCGGALAALVAVWLLGARKGPIGLRSESDLVRIVVAASAGSAILGTAALLGGVASGVDDLEALVWASILNEGASMLVWLPLAMRHRESPSLAHWPERAVQWGLLVVVTAAVFSTDEGPAFAYVVLAILAWAGLRFLLLETLVQLIVVRLIAVSLTGLGHGPFAEAAHGQDLPPDLEILFVQVFLMVCSLAVVALSLSSARARAAVRQQALVQGGRAADAKLSTVVEELEAERSAVEELREVDRVKDAFVSTVSHELRTPITNIIGYTEMLDDGDYGPLSPPQGTALSRIGENGRRLKMLIDDLLTLSRLRSAELDLELRPVDLVQVVRAAEILILPRIRNAGLSLEMDLSPQPVMVQGDADQLERVLVNLMSNAVKFTPAMGRVTVVLRPEGDEAVVSVSDTGFGIAPDDLERLFTQFFRTSQAQERHIQGTGLGLSIVRKIVEGHGGRVEVESALDVGTTFRVRLPC